MHGPHDLHFEIDNSSFQLFRTSIWRENVKLKFVAQTKTTSTGSKDYRIHWPSSALRSLSNRPMDRPLATRPEQSNWTSWRWRVCSSRSLPDFVRAWFNCPGGSLFSQKPKWCPEANRWIVVDPCDFGLKQSALNKLCVADWVEGGESRCLINNSRENKHCTWKFWLSTWLISKF